MTVSEQIVVPEKLMAPEQVVVPEQVMGLGQVVVPEQVMGLGQAVCAWKRWFQNKRCTAGISYGPRKRYGYRQSNYPNTNKIQNNCWFQKK